MTPNVTLPTPASLRRYGLTPERYTEFYISQGGKCGCCERSPPEVKLVIDHEHIRGWRWLPPYTRSLFVRGLLCVMCNLRLVARGMTTQRARNITSYLAKYDLRRPSSIPKVKPRKRRKHKTKPQI